MTDDHERPVTQPPRPFDDGSTDTMDGAPPAGLPAVADLDSGEAADGEDSDSGGPEVVAEGVEPEEPAPFEDLSELPALLEALLFVADHPIDSGYLARAVELSVPRVEHALDALAESLREGRRGIRLQRGPAGVQLVSAPEAAEQVERFLGLEANRRLSQAALETLAIIAYRQPITRGQIDAVRGVSSDGAVATLRARDLIESAGHASGPGRPMLFRTTQRFLEHFGLERPGQLPPLPEDVDLPPAEIQAQLGLDEDIVLEALKPREEPEPEWSPEGAQDGEDSEGGEDGDARTVEAGEDGEAAAEADRGADGDEDGPTAGETDATEDLDASDGTMSDAADEIDEAIAASGIGDLVDIPSDVRALSDAAEQAFEASRDRLTAVEDAPAPDVAGAPDEFEEAPEDASDG
ncbi:MAG: SMC-Scp complex subunit ScpB [Dehalococcoidia bacterium]|nr:SMC-Scp complex subunit ScpB [Dehalococcoidia bacterium]